MCSKFIFCLLWFSSFWALISAETGRNRSSCENVNLEDFNYSELMGSWYKVFGTGIKQSQSCGLVKYFTFNGAGFQISFDNSTNLAMILNGKTLITINGILYQHVVDSNSYANYRLVFFCPVNDGNLPDLRWVLSSSSNFDSADETLHQLLGPNEETCDYVSNSPPTTIPPYPEPSTSGSSEQGSDPTLQENTNQTTPLEETTTLETSTDLTSQTTPELQPTEDATIPTPETTSTDKETTTIETTPSPTPEITKDPETTEQTSTTAKTPQVPTQTLPPSSNFPKGFKIPGSDKIFYFESQIRKYFQDQKPHF